MLKKVSLLLAALTVAAVGATAAPASAVSVPERSDVATSAKQAGNPQGFVPGKGTPPRVSKAANDMKRVPPTPAKDGKAAPAVALATCPPKCYKYARGYTFPPAGAQNMIEAHTSIHKPILQPQAAHSLWEIAVDGNSTGNDQTIEVGWTVDDQGVNPDNTNPYLFVGCWIGGVFQGYNGGCGWTPNTAAPYKPGVTSLASLVGASRGEREFGFLYNSGRWYATFDGYYLGYFTESSWPSAFSSIYKYQLFGEYGGGVNASCADMGNGTAGSTATSGWAPASGPARVDAVSSNLGAAQVGLTLSTQDGNYSTGNAIAGQGGTMKFTYGGVRNTGTVCN
jgi:hypothetical protein